MTAMLSKAGVLSIALLCCSLAALARDVTDIRLTIKNHRFQPAQVTAPIDKPITLQVENLDSTPVEFESEPLGVEKIIAGSGEALIHIRPLKSGRYEFFDEFHEEDARGVLIVR
jgi:hypothetical protein